MIKVNLAKILSSFFEYSKKLDVSEKIIRRNTFYYNKAQLIFTSLHNKGLLDRKTEIKILLNNSFKNKTSHLLKFKPNKNGIKVLPFIDKYDIQKKPKRFITTLGKFSVTSSTSGSTGVPLTLYRSFSSIVFEQAAIDCIYRYNGLDPLTSKIAILRGDTVKDANELEAPYWKYNSDKRILRLSSHHMNIETINNYLDELNLFSPDIIYAYPSSIELFSHLITKSNNEYTVPLVITSSEVFTTESREKVSLKLNCIICDYYGQAERISFAYSNNVEEYYFLPGYSFTELEFKYNEQNYDYYEIIGTSLWNKSMPIQRYKTGDLAVLPKGLIKKEIEKICYGINPFKGILGRTSEYLLSPKGHRLIGINQIPKFTKKVVRMQFVQNKLDSVDIYVITEKGFTRKNENEIIKNAREKIPLSMNINIIITEQLQKTKALKTPLVIRNI